MSESDTMFNEQDRRCAAVQFMLSTDPGYETGLASANDVMHRKRAEDFGNFEES